MKAPEEHDASFDEVLASFLADLEQGADREPLIRAYAGRYPEHAAEFREYANWPALLDVVSEEVDEHRPARLGDFRIVREISHGGMKTVYEAIQEPLERRVAVATIRRGRILPAHRERFLREQRVLAQLHQTHIVPIFAAGEAGPIQYFVMPYIEGAALHHIIQIASCAETRRADTPTPSLKELAQRVLHPVAGNATTWSAIGSAPPPASSATVADSATIAAPAEPPTLSREYYRSVAKVLADVAESLEHAHTHGFLHRDLKPANIMVGTDERSWLIDFGLAGFLQRPDPPTAQAYAPDVGEALTSTRGVLGTPGYMAPEQAAGEPTDARTDVWGLGATLYELLTLRPAFPDQLRGTSASASAGAAPPAPRRVIRNIPRDLEAICLKSLREDPGDRYQAAGDVAEDLHRWLRGEPTRAHPARAPRRVYLWARRNKGWAAALAMSLVAVCGLAAGVSWVQRSRAQEQKRENLMLQAADLLAPGQTSGWSDRAWELERQVLQVRRDERVRNQAVTILAGLDAAQPVVFPEFGSQSMRFDPQGQRLLMGTLEATSEGAVTAKLWQVGADGLQEFRGTGGGPVAFGVDGTPLQLTLRPAENELVLVNLSQGQVVSRFARPAGATWNFSDEVAVAADGSTVAAAAATPDGQPAGIWLWNAASRSWLPPLSFRAPSALAFSPDGTLLGAGDEDGAIAIWSVRTGQLLASLRAARNAILALAFSRDRRRTASSCDPETSGWLLAAGDEGGTVTIWDLTRKLPRSYCRGHGYEVRAVAFSPDGVTLASAGREAKLWDVATGRLLLNPLNYSDALRGLAFSPDGRRLAVGGQQHPRRSLVVWELTDGRGITGLRGLVCPISKTCFSPDGRYVAALAHNWEVAIWDLQTGFLLHVLEAPRGIFADNAALAFSPDGRRFAFSAGHEAKVWDVATGREVQRWELCEGFVDQLAYAGPDRLLSLRVETQAGRLGPYSNAPPDQHPRVCRLRALREQAAPQLLQEITEFNWHVFSTGAAPQGQWFVVEGLAGSRQEKRRLLKVFDATGRELATLPTANSAACQTAMHVADPTGHLLGVMTGPEGVAEMTLFDMPSCRVVDKLGAPASCLSPEGKYFAVNGIGFSLMCRGVSEPVVVFDENQPMVAVQPRFDGTGARLAWGRTDGTVAVAYLPEVRRRLAELGLGW